MNGKLSKILLCILCASLPYMGNTNEVTHDEAAMELLQTVKIEQVINQTIDILLQAELEKNPSMKPYERVFKEFFERYIGWETLRVEYVSIYTETYTEEELIEMNNFFSTPTGQKSITTGPALMLKGQQIGERQMMDNISELQYMIETEAERITELQNQE